MKHVLFVTVLSLFTVSAFADSKKEVKKTTVTHSKDHAHEGVADHEHDESHHADAAHGKVEEKKTETETKVKKK